jgi:inhibitor of cysteine peptidase
MKAGRIGTALGLMMVLVIIAATAIGLYVAPGSGTRIPNDGDHGSPVDWQPEPSLDGGLQRFASREEMEDFLATAPSYPGYWFWNGRGGDVLFMADSFGTSESAAPGYSSTNIQVEGVDEADIVKSDGRYIYLAIDNRLIIARAYPAEEARVIWEREMEGTIQGLFINGDRLAVLESGGPVYATGWRWGLGMEGASGTYEIETTVRVYDVTDRADPVLEREVSLDGYYVSARLIGDYVYLVASGSAWVGEDDIDLPRIDGGDGTVRVQPEEIWHSETPDSGYAFTTIMSVNMIDKDEEAGHETLLVGGASTVYVSPDNIYITFPEWRDASGQTSIHRIHIDQGRIEYQATGKVPGSLLNQFSLDEQGEYLRVATTDWNWEETARARQDSNLYVLDQSLDIFGRLENVAPGESIHSARFMGDRCYLVTFQQTDPLFVIDLADPGHPAVLGELVMPGFSDYLHPYDETHLIGVGMLDSSVKISLYDVTDPGHPREMSTYLVGDGTDDDPDGWSWASTPVLYDHRAFLFDRERGLLVLPVSIQGTVYRGPVEGESVEDGIAVATAYNGSSWQGAYVFDISLEEGLELAGRISHYAGANGSGEFRPDPPSSYSEESSYSDYESFYRCAIERSLYIGDVLYTISDHQIGMNDLKTLAEIGAISLN